MKTIFILITVLFFNLTSFAAASLCDGNSQTMGGGVDVWPWSVAKPFPWDNIQGYWKLGNNNDSYIKARVLSTTKNRKILSLQLFGEGICSKPYAKGTGYVDVSEKNVVRAILSDGVYKYQLKLGMFDPRDVDSRACGQNIMAASMQVIDLATKSTDKGSVPLDPGVTETHNMMLKKATVDPVNACKMVE